MTERTWHGHWWIPGREDDGRQPGTLTVSADGEIILTLVGGFDLSVQTALEDGSMAVSIHGEPVPLLLGQCESVEITLVDCYTKHSRGVFGFGTPTFHVLGAGRALIGMHLMDRDAPVFKSAHLTFENLMTWLQTNGLEQSADYDNKSATVQFTSPEILEAEVAGWRIKASTVFSGFQFRERRGKASVEGDARPVIAVTSDHPISFNGFDDISKAFMDLLTLASGEASGVISTVLVRQRPTVHSGDDGEESLLYPKTIDVFAQHTHSPRPDASPQESRRFLFTCEDMPFDKLVAAWLPLRMKTLAASDVLFGLQYARPGFTETRLLSAAVAAESLHRTVYGSAPAMSESRFAALRETVLEALDDPDDQLWVKERLHNQLSYKDRLLDLANRPAPEAVDRIIPDRAQWAKELRDARNGLAHTGSGADVTFDMFDLVEVTIFLLYLVLLKELGLSDEVQIKAVRQNEYLSSLRSRRPSKARRNPQAS